MRRTELSWSSRTRGVALWAADGEPETVQLVAHRDLQGLPDHTVPWILLPRQGTQLLARSTIIHLVTEPQQPRPALPATVSVRCLPLASPLRRRIEVVLSKVGINIASTGFVATVDL